MKSKSNLRPLVIKKKSVTTPKLRQELIGPFEADNFSLKKKEKRVDYYFALGGIFSTIILAVFAYLIIAQHPVPDYLIGFVGSVIGYYLLVKPFETKTR